MRPEKIARRTLLLAGVPAALAGCTWVPAARVAHHRPARELPAKVLACYYASWDTATWRIGDVPAEFNVIHLFHAKPAGRPVNRNWNNAGDGAFRFEHHAEVPAWQVQRCRARGQKVILTVGGQRAGFNFDSRPKSRNFVESFRAMHDALGGLDGCDFNNFEARIGSSPAEMIWIAQQLRSLYGPHFAITAPPQPNSPEDRALLKAMAAAGVLSWAAPQFYDWDGFNAAGFIHRRTADWVRDLGADKVVLGLAANYPDGPSLHDCIREWEAVKASHPGVRGMFCWNAQFNLQGGNVWGRTMRARL